MAEPLSYAQSLRVVGQELDDLGVDSFELAKWGDDYIVWPKPAEFLRKRSAKKGFLSKITQQVLPNDESAEEVRNHLYFTPSEILWADTQRRSNRQISGSPSDLRDLSFVLRVLGDHLDRKRPRQFTISGSKTSIVINYDQKQESFTSQDLYDYGIHMYMRRSTRGNLP